MPLKNTNKLPPGGWRYPQKETGWKLNSMAPFHDAVNDIVSHRNANKLDRATYSEAAEDLDAFTCQRLGEDPAWCGQKKITHEANPSPQGWFKGAGHAVLAAKTGAAILSEWLGEGGQPVDSAVAQNRANVCADCEENKQGNFFTNLTATLARAIHDQRRVKLDKGMKVTNEADLHTCGVCSCHLPLLVWVPAPVLAAREPAERLSTYPAECWKAREISQQSEPKPKTIPIK